MLDGPSLSHHPAWVPAFAGTAEFLSSLRSLRNSGWLGDLDSNQGCPVQSREFYR